MTLSVRAVVDDGLAAPAAEAAPARPEHQRDEAAGQADHHEDHADRAEIDVRDVVGHGPGEDRTDGDEYEADTDSHVKPPASSDATDHWYPARALLNRTVFRARPRAGARAARGGGCSDPRALARTTTHRERTTPSERPRRSCAGRTARHVKAIDRFVDAGYDHVYVHQVGPDQDVFFELYEREILPSYSPSSAKSEP